MIYFKVLKYPFFIFEVNLKYFVLGSKRYFSFQLQHRFSQFKEMST